MEKKKKYIIAFILLFVVVIMLVWLFYSFQSHKTNPTADNTTTESKSLYFTQYNNTADTITIPGIDGLNLKAGQLNQQVAAKVKSKRTYIATIRLQFRL